MRSIIIVLIITLAALQYKLWVSEDSIPQWMTLEKKLLAQEQENETLAKRNRAVEADIAELKSGEQALEGQARYELGMVKDNEVYYQFVE